MALEYRLAALLRADKPNQYSALAVFRGPDQPIFTHEESRLFGTLIPHIKRALYLQKRFAKLDQERWNVMGVMDQMPMGVVICDQNTRVIFANRMARELAEQKDGLILRHGEMWSNTHQESATFRDAIKQVVNGMVVGETRPSMALPLTRRKAFQPLHVRINPLHAREAPFPVHALKQPAAVVYITDPDQAGETSQELLRRMFGLTPREATLLNHLTKGLEMGEAAHEMGVTPHTARSFLKSIFAKTGTARQAELIKQVVTSPAWMRQSA